MIPRVSLSGAAHKGGRARRRPGARPRPCEDIFTAASRPVAVRRSDWCHGTPEGLAEVDRPVIWKELSMTSMTLAAHSARTVGSVLAIIHEGWIKEVSSFLAPAMEPHADLWSQWEAARFLDDQFGGRFRLECALADALDDVVSPDVAARLTATREAIERTSEDLVAAGRRHDSPTLTGILARRFIEEVARWCVELEFATARLAPAELSLEARRLLARLRVADALGR